MRNSSIDVDWHYICYPWSLCIERWRTRKCPCLGHCQCFIKCWPTVLRRLYVFFDSERWWKSNRLDRFHSRPLSLYTDHRDFRFWKDRVIRTWTVIAPYWLSWFCYSSSDQYRYIGHVHTDFDHSYNPAEQRILLCLRHCIWDSSFPSVVMEPITLWIWICNIVCGTTRHQYCHNRQYHENSYDLHYWHWSCRSLSCLN